MNADKKLNRENAVPWLNLAPRLKRPLSYRAPLDYLRLLYWVFFFPQALGWYINEFGKDGYQDIRGSKIPGLVLNDPVQRRLVVQALVALFIAVPGISLGLSVLGVSVDWIAVAVAITLAVMFERIVGTVFGFPFGVTFGVTFGVVGSIFGGAAIGWGGSLQADPVFGAVLGAAPGAAIGTALTATGCLKSGVDEDFVQNVTGGSTFMMVGGVIFAITSLMTLVAPGVTTSLLTSNLNTAAFFSIGFGAAFSVSLLRLPDYLPLLLTGTLYWYCSGKRRTLSTSRVIFLPLPGLQRQLEDHLNSDWEAGLHNANQLLTYTLQFTPVIKAINAALASTSNKTLLSKVNTLVNQTIDWSLIRFCSVSLKNQFRQNAIDGFFFLFPKRKKQRQNRFSVEPRVDTAARAACAGFWYWHREESGKAAEAFANVQELCHGPELYYTAHAIDLGLLVDKEKDGIRGIAEWEQKTRRLKNLPDPPLRYGTLEVLQTLRTVAGDVGAVGKAWSPLRRSAIIIRCIEILNRIIASGKETCPHPEWPLIKEIVQKWQTLLVKSGWVISKEMLSQPVNNPYQGYSGRPVTGATFTGRNDIMRQIGNRWAVGGLLEPLVVYGHRRMGKTSILKNLEGNTESDMVLAYLTMQNVGLVDHTGQFLLEFAEVIHAATVKAGLTIGPPPGEEDYNNLGTARRALNALLDKLAPHMAGQKRLVLAIDEFELIAKYIKEKRIHADFLSYLRARIQEYNWLGVIFAGLHTLEEMERNYDSAFFSQAESLRVSYLERDDAMRLITQPHPGFALEYSPDLIEKLYRLTFGQPYLIQRLCWELVTHWNERFLQEGEKTPRILNLDDLSVVLTSDFFKSADYYFDGVWSNVTENEQVLMRIIAIDEERIWTLDALYGAVKDHPSFSKSGTLEETLKLLARHDVIVEEEKGVRFACELMRCWAAAKG